MDITGVPAVDSEVTNRLLRTVQATREYARSMGFGKTDTTPITTTASELASNILVHAGKGSTASPCEAWRAGKVIFSRVSMGEERGLEIVFSDQRPSIEDTERAFGCG